MDPETAIALLTQLIDAAGDLHDSLPLIDQEHAVATRASVGSALGLLCAAKEEAKEWAASVE